MVWSVAQRACHPHVRTGPGLPLPACDPASIAPPHERKRRLCVCASDSAGECSAEADQFDRPPSPRESCNQSDIGWRMPHHATNLAGCGERQSSRFTQTGPGCCPRPPDPDPSHAQPVRPSPPAPSDLQILAEHLEGRPHPDGRRAAKHSLGVINQDLDRAATAAATTAAAASARGRRACTHPVIALRHAQRRGRRRRVRRRWPAWGRQRHWRRRCGRRRE
eukprot:5614989-Prymnesium_polylepis.1